LASIAGDALLSRLLASSPTVTVERKIADSTRQIKKDLVDLDIRHRDLDAKHRALKTQHTALEIKSAKRAAAVKRFSMQTVKRVAKNKVVELTSLPERAIPYVGIGVLIGTTAYEIYSDCELLTELNELSAEHDQGAADTTSVCGFKVPSKEEVWRQVKSGSNSALGAIYERLPALSPAAPKPGDVQK
jgi:hypothetical protein